VRRIAQIHQLREVPAQFTETVAHGLR
jgi:hypothetical protein